MAEIEKNIFREYDLRGEYGKDLNEREAELIGQAVATYLKSKNARTRRMVVGRDGRLSSPALCNAVEKGLMESGISVIDIGIVPTPAYSYAIFKLKADGGIMVTASHNPSKYNGFKLNIKTDWVSGKGIQELLPIINKEKFLRPKKKGQLTHAKILEQYAEYLVKNTRAKKKLKIVVDGGNGVAGEISCKILRRLGHQVIPLYCKPDGRFPNHLADPSAVDNLKDLIEKVKKEKADFGVALDGDGDRIGVISENGRIIWGDRLLIIFARQILKEHRGAIIVFEVKCSKALEEDVALHGGKPIMSKTGHNVVEARMQETNALLAGEMSGHMYFRDRHQGFGDAIYAACRISEILSLEKKTITEILADIPAYYSTEELRLPFPDNAKFELVKKFTKKMKKLQKKEKFKVIDLDGCRLEYLDGSGWALLRAANTKPELSLRFEGRTQKELKHIYLRFQKYAKKSLRLPKFERVRVSR